MTNDSDMLHELRENGYQRTLEVASFPWDIAYFHGDLRRSKWGVASGVVFKRGGALITLKQ